MKTLHVNIADLSIGTSSGTVIANAEQLSACFTTSQLNKLAEKYLGKFFEPGTKKSEACNMLYDAMIKALGEDTSPKKEKATKQTKTTNEPAKPTSYTAPQDEDTDTDEANAENEEADMAKKAEAPAKTKKAVAEKPVVKKKQPVKKVATEKPVKEAKEPKEPKTPKPPKEPAAPKSYTFIAPGKSVKIEEITDADGKKFSKQGRALIEAFVGGVDKGKKVTLTKEEILAKLEEVGYACSGNVWNNFMWYRMKFKAIGLME